MAIMNKEACISLRLTKPERRELEQTAALLGEDVTPLAASYVREGVRRYRFPAIEFRDGMPGFIIAVSNLYYDFIKYAKLWELYNTRKGQDI